MTTRRFLPLLTLLTALFALPGRNAQAQILSVYGTYSPVHVTDVETGVTTTTTGSQTQYTDLWAHGFGGGVTVNFLPLPLISLGFDFRGSTRPGTVGADTAMAGIKLGVHPPLIHIKPYIQASAGYLATRTINVTTVGNVTGSVNVVGGTIGHQYLAYEVVGGIDYPLVHFVDLRIIEVGGGQAIGAGTVAPSLLTINTGIVLHF